MLMIGLTILGLGFAVGSTLSGQGVERFLIYGVLATSLMVLIWGYSQQIISLTQISFTLISVTAYGVYTALRTTRGVAYG